MIKGQNATGKPLRIQKDSQGSNLPHVVTIRVLIKVTTRRYSR